MCQSVCVCMVLPKIWMNEWRASSTQMAYCDETPMFTIYDWWEVIGAGLLGFMNGRRMDANFWENMYTVFLVIFVDFSRFKPNISELYRFMLSSILSIYL